MIELKNKEWAKQGPPQSWCMTQGTAIVTHKSNQPYNITKSYIYLWHHYGTIIG
jgi:hypothetical protein